MTNMPRSARLSALDADEKIHAFRERLKNFDAQYARQIQNIGLFSNAPTSDSMRLLQGDISKLLTQAKLQPDVFDLTPRQLTDLTELRAKVRAMMTEASPSAIKKTWTDVREQAKASQKPVSAQSVFKQWAKEKRAVNQENKNTPERPGPASTNQ